jgi:5-methylcytosine-specific restriction endonuclease McrA
MSSWQKDGNAPKRLTGRALQRRNVAIALRDGYACYVCGRITADGQVDHKVALTKGGTDEASNLAWICRTPCHEDKSRAERGQRPGPRPVGVDGFPL